VRKSVRKKCANLALPVVLTEARNHPRREAAESDFERKPFQGRQN